MKILYYSPHPHLNLISASGYGTHMREMIIAFRKAGCDVLPIIMGGEGNISEEISGQAGNSKAFIRGLLPKNLWRTIKDINLLQFDYYTAVIRLEEAIENFKPDFIYERCNYLQLSGVRMAKKHHVLHAMELNSPYVDQKNELGKSHSYIEKYARQVEKKQLFGTNLALTLVGPLKTYFCERYKINPGKFLITPDAFNRENIQLDTDNQQKIKTRYQLSGQNVIGYIGSIFEWHGLDKMIRAFDTLNPPRTKLLVVGYGEYMKILVALVKELGREDDVIFTGMVPRQEVFDYIQLMDICVAPNAAWYQSPVKIFEYGAMGKPILGPDIPSVREIMEPGKDGILVEPTTEALMDGLQELLQNRERAVEQGKHFQQKVLNEYTWDKNAESILKAISNLKT